MAMKWQHFSPTGNGGSFGREDMGVFCEVEGVLLVVPLFETATSQLSMEDVEVLAKDLLDQPDKAAVYELRDGVFSKDLVVDWKTKIKNSLVFLPEEKV